jgi:hypothetical protein
MASAFGNVISAIGDGAWHFEEAVLLIMSGGLPSLFA